MQPPASSGVRRWRILAGVTGGVVLALAGAVLVPPGTLPYPPKSTYSDAQVSHWPNAYFLRQAVLEEHTWPFWNPSKMLGQPFAANPLSKVWYPPQWLALVIPPTAHLDLLIYLHLIWLGIGVVIWARSARQRMLTALFMALAWGLNPKLIGHLGAGHLDILYALAWAPWVMWAGQRLADQPGIGRGILLGVTMALQTLADVRMAAYFVPLAIIAVVIAGYNRGRPRDLLPGGIAALAALALLTAVQTIPVLAVGPYLTRAAISPLDAADFSLPPRYLIGLILPDIGGQHELMTALGLPVVVLAGFSARDRERRKPALVWCGVILLAMLWALGRFGPLFLPATNLIPMLTWLRIPSRAWFVVAFGMIVLSGMGLESLLARGPGRIGRLVATAMAFSGLITVIASAILELPGVMMGVGGALVGTGLGLWVMGAAPGGDGGAKPARSTLIGAGILMTTLALSLLGLDLTLIIPKSIADIEQPELAVISQIDPECRTVYSPTFELIGPATISSGIVTLHGVDPFQLRGSAALIATAAGVSPHGYSVIAPPMPPGETDLTRVEPRLDLLREAGVCAVVSSFPLEMPGLEKTGQSGQVSIYRVTDDTLASPNGDLRGANIWRPRVVGFTQTTTEVCIDAGAELPFRVVIPQSWAPGWRAWIDGRPAAVDSLMDGGFLAVEVDSSGCHSIGLAYRPLPDLIGLGVSGLACLALAAGWLISRRGSRHV